MLGKRRCRGAVALVSGSVRCQRPDIEHALRKLRERERILLCALCAHVVVGEALYIAPCNAVGRDLYSERGDRVIILGMERKRDLVIVIAGARQDARDDRRRGIRRGVHRDRLGRCAAVSAQVVAHHAVGVVRIGREIPDVQAKRTVCVRLLDEAAVLRLALHAEEANIVVGHVVPVQRDRDGGRLCRKAGDHLRASVVDPVDIGQRIALIAHSVEGRAAHADLAVRQRGRIERHVPGLAEFGPGLAVVRRPGKGRARHTDIVLRLQRKARRAVQIGRVGGGEPRDNRRFGIGVERCADVLGRDALFAQRVHTDHIVVIDMVLLRSGVCVAERIAVVDLRRHDEVRVRARAAVDTVDLRVRLFGDGPADVDFGGIRDRGHTDDLRRAALVHGHDGGVLCVLAGSVRRGRKKRVFSVLYVRNVPSQRVYCRVFIAQLGAEHGPADLAARIALHIVEHNSRFVCFHRSSGCHRDIDQIPRWTHAVPAVLRPNLRDLRSLQRDADLCGGRNAPVGSIRTNGIDIFRIRLQPGVCVRGVRHTGNFLTVAGYDIPGGIRTGMRIPCQASRVAAESLRAQAGELHGLLREPCVDGCSHAVGDEGCGPEDVLLDVGALCHGCSVSDAYAGWHQL